MDKLRLTITTFEEQHRRLAKETVAEMRHYIPEAIKALQQLEKWRYI